MLLLKLPVTFKVLSTNFLNEGKLTTATFF